MDRAVQRKPRLHFDVATHPSHVTFDDGKEQRRNMPWLNYEEANWGYAEPDLIRMEMGECVVELHGHNLGPLFQAIEEQTLFRVRAQPELKREREREGDTFVVGIRFLVAAAPRLPGSGPDQLGLMFG